MEHKGISGFDGTIFINSTTKLSNNQEACIHRAVMPDIINVEMPNDRTVFVQFADGTKEVAHASEEDEFNFQFGIAICLMKKLLSVRTIGSSITGSSAYNKLMKYAESKINQTKRDREAAKRKGKELKEEEAAEKRMIRKEEQKEREYYIDLMVEAIMRALKASEKE